MFYQVLSRVDRTSLIISRKYNDNCNYKQKTSPRSQSQVLDLQSNQFSS